MSVAGNLARVRQSMAQAARAAGREVDDIALIVVCKRQPIESIFEAYDAGARVFGESTVQGLCTTAEAFEQSGRKVQWHFIGRLQRNKLNKLLPHGPVIQTVDSEELADGLCKRAVAELSVLVQVNIGGETQKGGVTPAAAVAFARGLSLRRGLRLRGLMGMPPYGEDPVPYFTRMAELSSELMGTTECQGAHELSMGMTDDFEAAIRCGSTMVRVGTAIFGERLHPVKRGDA